MPQRRFGLPVPVKLMGATLADVRPTKLCCPLRSASKSGYVNGNGLVASGLRERATTSPWLAIPGTGFSSDPLIQLKMVVLAPIPNARVRIVMPAYPGALTSTRRAYFTSCVKVDIGHSPATSVTEGIAEMFHIASRTL